jgi:L-lactate dehydrogenase complex protein LldF
MLAGLDAAQHLPRASTLCGACREACPVKIDIPRMLLDLRHQLVEREQVTQGEKILFMLWAWVMQHPNVYLWLTCGLAKIQRLWTRNGWFRKLPQPFAG